MPKRDKKEKFEENRKKTIARPDPEKYYDWSQTFSLFQTPLVIHVIKWKCSRDDKHLLAWMVKVCGIAVANFSKVPSSRQISFMRWILHLSNSSLKQILDCILLESARLDKLANKLWSNFSTAEKLGDHESVTMWSALSGITSMKLTARPTPWRKKAILTDIWDQDHYLKEN